MVAARFIEAGDQMRAAGASGTGAHAEAAREFGLTGGGQRRAFLMPDADPFDLAPPNRIRKRIEGIADQSEYVLDADLFEHADQKFRNRLGHLVAPIVGARAVTGGRGRCFNTCILTIV